MYIISYYDIKEMDTIIYAECKTYFQAKEKYKEIKHKPFADMEYKPNKSAYYNQDFFKRWCR